MTLGGQAANAIGAKGGGDIVAPVNRDRPTAFGARVGEAAEGEELSAAGEGGLVGAGV